MKDPEIIVIGGGIGCLCCAGLLAKAGKRVLILEAHTKPGGAAHAFNKNGYKFESGPSLLSGIGSWPTTNPLGQILKLQGQEVELVKYQDWNVQVPEGIFTIGVGDKRFNEKIKAISGDKAIKEWEVFLKAIKPIAAAMATLFENWFKPNAYLEYPKGGSESIVNALLNGIYSFGGELKLNSRVDEIIIDKNKASAVKLQNGKILNAEYIVSNADIWNTIKLLPQEVAKRWKRERSKTPKCESFLHIHLGFNAEGLGNIPIHSIWVDDWKKGIRAERNVVVLSIPSVADPSMAPPNKHILHGYTPSNEPWEFWENLRSKDENYKDLKEERCSIFWKPLENLIPDIKERCEIKMFGTPLTHRRFLNTTNGSYGSALSAAEGLFPGNKTPIKNLFLCGASTFPGIGIPQLLPVGH